MKVFNVIAASVAVAMTAGVANADMNSQLASLQAQVNQLQAQVSNAGGSSMSSVVGVNPNLSWAMMGNQAGVGKELTLLQARQNGLNNPITIGGFAQGDLAYQNTNQQGFFNQTSLQNGASLNASGSNASQLLLSNADLSITAAIGQWVTAYIQTGANNAGASGGNSNLSIQDAYAVFGNLAKNPVYGFAGKKDLDFGSFSTVNMYAQPLTRQAFAVYGVNTAGVGVNAYGFNGTVSLLNGGAQGNTSYAVGNTASNLIGLGNPTNAYTQQNQFGQNFAVNLGYGMNTSGVNWNVGAGYLNGGSNSFVNTSGNANGVWDVNGKVSVAGFDLTAEFDMTAQNTLATASTVNAWDVGADYNFPVMGINSVVSADYSQLAVGGGYSNLQQFVLGYRVEPVTNVWTGLEWSYNKNGVVNIGSIGSTNYTNVYGSGLTTNQILWDVTAAF